MSEATPAPAPYIGFARKWRPKDFDDLAGQDQVAKALRAEVEKGRIGHAYLFSGPRGIGKTSSARILAKAINCAEGPTPKPCGVCEHCRAITAGASMDVIEIDGASNNGVDQIRDLRESINHVPFACRYKIYIIDEVHMLSIQAFNALLKTLEEPPSFVVFIFATTEPEKIPDTIKSRCQPFSFRAITLEDIVARLDYIVTQEGAEIEESERRAILEAIALAAEGGMRDAQVALDQVISLSSGPLRLQDVRDFLGVADQNSLFDVVEHIRDRNTTALIEAVRRMIDRGRDLERYTKQMLAFLRDLLILHCGGTDDLVRLSAEGIPRARELANSIDTATLINAVNQFLDLEARMRQGSTPRFLLEFTFVRLTALEDVAAIGDLIQRLESGEGGGAMAAAPAAARPSPKPSTSKASSKPASPDAGASSPEIAPGASSAPASIPLAGGGALEPAGSADLGQVREMLVKAVREVDISLCNSLKCAPLERIENNVAYFGRPGESIPGYDLRRLQKPESKSVLCDALKRLTGADNITVRFGARGQSFVAKKVAHAAPHPVPVPVKPPPAEPAHDSPPDAHLYDVPPAAAIEEAPEETDEGACEDYEISLEAARQAFGKKGLSAAGIRAMLQDNPPLREKIELVRKMFGGNILDGDNRPVKM